MLFADEFLDEAFQVAVENYGTAWHLSAVDHGASDLAVLNQNLLNLGGGLDLDSVFPEPVAHHLDHQIRAALERIDALAHEAPEDDSGGDGGFVQARSVGIGYRLQQKPPDIGAPREKPVEEVSYGVL